MQKDLEIAMTQVQRRSAARSVIRWWEELVKGMGSAWHAGKLNTLGISRWSATSPGEFYEVKCLGREFFLSVQVVQSASEKLYAAVRLSEAKSDTAPFISVFIQDDGALIAEDGVVLTTALSKNPMSAAEVLCRLLSDQVIALIPKGGPILGETSIKE